MMAAIEAAATHSNSARAILIILVMAGLDPVIHVSARAQIDAVDHRVKLGDDNYKRRQS
jgi:hypothetical protein